MKKGEPIFLKAEPTFLKNSEAQVTLQDIENLALQEDALSTKVRELKEKREILDENIQVSLNEAISIIEQSLEAVRKKMYGDFSDHKTLTTTAQKVQQMKEIVEGQLKEASEQINKSEEFLIRFLPMSYQRPRNVRENEFLCIGSGFSRILVPEAKVTLVQKPNFVLARNPNAITT